MAAFDQTNRENINVFRFMVQLQESDSVTGLNNEKTGEQVFKTVASTRVPSLDKSQLRVSYHWDPVLDHVDLTRADIVLDTQLITYPSCLEHIQVMTGSQVISLIMRCSLFRSLVLKWL